MQGSLSVIINTVERHTKLVVETGDGFYVRNCDENQARATVLCPLGISTKLQKQDAKAVHRVSDSQIQWVIPVKRNHRVLVLVGGTQSTDTEPVASLAAISQVFYPRFITTSPRPRTVHWQLGVGDEPPGL